MAAVPFLAPWGAPLAAPTVNPEPVFLAPPEMGGLPYLAPQGVPRLAPVLASGAMAYFAPPLMEGLPFLAPQFVPVTLILPQVNGSGRRASRSSVSRVSRAKSAPVPAHVPYHSRAYEQDERERSELDDEETILAFLMEYALV